ncbi:MAG: AMP-binding protein [Opitutales bacterium]
MESTTAINLEDLRRDWLFGLSGEDIYREVLEFRSSLEGRDSEYIIREEEPHSFTRKFFASVSLGLPTVLASPKWRGREEEQFIQLMALAKPKPGTILIPTGGTTGGVKLAIHDWESLSAGARATQAFLGGGAIHSCCVLPLHHVSGLMQLVRSFVSGGTIRFDEDKVKGSCLSLVPTQLKRLMETEDGIHKLNTAEVVFVGGAAMPAQVTRQARELMLPVVPVYGMTETAAMVAAIPQADFLDSEGAGALPLGDAQITVDPDGAIRIRSSALFKGYHGGECIDLSEGYRTGDAGWLNEDGRLFLMGRMDALINTGGEKVDPAEVREALLQLDGISGARVVGEPDEEWGEIVVAYLCMAKGKQVVEAQLREALKQYLSPHKIPKRVEWQS